MIPVSKRIASSLPDEDLVRTCLDGSEEAWETLIDRYRKLIFSIPVKYGFSVDEASDVFQEICLKLLSELPRLREPRTLPAWVIRVTCHECFQRRRGLSRQYKFAGNAGREQTAISELADAAMLDAQREQMLREAVAELDPRCQRLIEMLFYTTPPLPYEDLAQELAIAKGSIGFIRMRCLSRLRRRLEEKGFV